MKTQNQTSRIYSWIIVLIIAMQSCVTYRAPLLMHQSDELEYNGIVHLKDCPVVCKERTVFFEEHIYNADATTCEYCGQKREVIITASR